MRVYISADIEGITGLVSWSQCSRPDGNSYDYPFARRMMTHDVNAAVRGARKGGATDIVIKDSHGNSKNLLIDELESGVHLVSGHGCGIDGMMEGIDAAFDAAMLVGYHGMAGASDALMEHALVGGLHRFWINDRPAGEILVSAGVGAAYGVPVVLVASDGAGCSEASHAIPGIVSCCTKHGFGKYMGQLLPPSVTRPVLERSAKRALDRLKLIPPVTIEGPVKMRASFRTAEQAELAAIVPGVRRLDGYTLEWDNESFLDAHRLALVVFQLSVQGRRSQE